MMRSVYVPLGGGLDGVTPPSRIDPGKLRLAINIEPKERGGYRSLMGYAKFDTNEISGEGVIRGIHYYNGKVYAFRHVSGGASTTMWESSGSGWTAKKTGLSPNGTYRCVNYAFGGSLKMYLASGVHKAAEWDGTTWTDITTGMTTDEPDHIIAHRAHLFLSFGPSVQVSPIGDPTGTWSVLTGSTEMLIDDDVTGFSRLPTGSLGIYSQKGITVLAGTSSSDFVANNLEEYSNKAGANASTIQNMGAKTLFMDSRGIRELGASDVASDLYDSLVSGAVDIKYRAKWANAIASCVVRAKSQYRLFLNDGSGLIVTIIGNRVQITEMEWPDVVYCVIATKNSSGNEVIYFGSDDGYIRQMESGKNFDSATIDCTMETAPNNCKLKNIIKRFRRLKFDAGTLGTSSLTVQPKINIGTSGLAANQPETPAYEGGTANPLGQALLGSSILGASIVREGDIDISSHGDWIRLLFTSSSSTESPWEVDGYTIDFMPGRKRR